MNIGKFVSSLLPSFEKKVVVSDLQMMKEELRDATLPPYQASLEFYDDRKFASKAIQNYDLEFGRSVKSKVRGNFIVITTRALENVNTGFDALEAIVQKEFPKDITSGGMTYHKANIIQYLNTISFSLRYSRKLLLWVLGEETTATGGAPKLDSPLTKAEKDWLWAQRETYYRCIQILSVPMKDAFEAMHRIPDMTVIPEEMAAVEHTVGATRLDPLGMGLISARLNPIYYVRMMIAEWQVSRFKAAQAERKALEYRLLALREAAEGRQDAKLETEIAYNEGRLQKLNRKLAEMEEDING